MSQQTESKSTINGTFKRFFRIISNGGYLLFVAVIVAVLWANFSHTTYHAVWHADLSVQLGSLTISKTIAHWIDDALMAIFFFLVGLEIKREFLVGGLSTKEKAILPVMAALGGMIVPAFVYFLINMGQETARGWGIPMATDIAFSLAILSIISKKVPFGLKLFLTAFAIADDLGAVMVIALFYTPEIQVTYLAVSLIFLLCLYLANRAGINTPLIYIILGGGLWGTIMGSGVHATSAGVITAFFIPATGKYDITTFVDKVKQNLSFFQSEKNSSILSNRGIQNTVLSMAIACRDVETPLQRFEHALQPWVSFLILPLFALANSGVVLKGIEFQAAVSHPVSMGIFLGLFMGKPVGILLFVWLASKFIGAELTSGISWRDIIGVSFLGGIGFTMSLFVSGLSFSSPEYLEYAKLGIITSSILCGTVGFIVLSIPIGKDNKILKGAP